MSTAEGSVTVAEVWTRVESDPTNIDTWMEFLSATDQSFDINLIRTNYEKFLDEFPLAESMWEKYAQHEETAGNFDKALSVYEKALATHLAFSVSMWTRFCTYISKHSSDTALIRSTFQRATEKVGSFYTASDLWTSYISWEEAQRQSPNVLKIFQQIVHFPLQHLSSLFERFKGYISAGHVEGLGEIEGFDNPEVQASLELKIPLAINHFQSIVDATWKSFSARSELELKVAGNLTSPSQFPMFTLKDEILEAWRNYLDFEDKNHTDLERLISLYERSLLSCFHYPEFWSRFASLLIEKGRVEAARAVWNRATSSILKRVPEAVIEHALFEEFEGNTEKSHALYFQLLSSFPDHLESIVSAAQFSRRTGKVQKAIDLLQGAIEKNDPSEANGSSGSDDGDEAASKKKKRSQRFCFLSSELALLQASALGDSQAALKTFQSALAKANDSKFLWISFVLFLEKSGKELNGEIPLISAYQQVLESSLSSDEKLFFWNRLLSHFHSSGSTSELKEATALYRKHFKGVQDRKRQRPVNGSGEDDDDDLEPERKKARAAHYQQSAAAAAAVDPNAHYNYAAYAAYPSYGAAPAAAVAPGHPGAPAAAAGAYDYYGGWGYSAQPYQ